MAITSRDQIVQLARAGVIEVDVGACLTCRECEVACSLYHEDECNPALSRIQIDYDDFAPGQPAITVCKQCDWPACFYACAARWDEPAIYLDERTGARVIDPDLCHGCGSCAKACPLMPEWVVIGWRRAGREGANGGRKRVYFKCDLCFDRPEGPICVEICPGQALTYVPATERKGR